MKMAESEGFEPPEGLTLRLISSQVHSTGLCQLSRTTCYVTFCDKYKTLNSFYIEANDCPSAYNMAEREGFEPPEGLTLRLISNQVHSTGLCHLSEK